jgi:hypothetical protein
MILNEALSANLEKSEAPERIVSDGFETPGMVTFNDKSLPDIERAGGAAHQEKVGREAR